MDRYIECKTQEQWNIVVDWAAKKYNHTKGNRFKCYEIWESYKENTIFEDKNYALWSMCEKKYYLKNGITNFTTFEEFCKQEGIIMKTTQQELDELKKSQQEINSKIAEIEAKIKEETELKVGDYIIFTNLKEDYTGYNGDVVQITRIHEEETFTKEVHKWISHTPNSFSGGGFRQKIGGALDGYILGEHFRKATTKEVEEYLIAEAKKRYKVGDTIDQRTAYDNNGGTYTIKRCNLLVSKQGIDNYLNVSIGGIGVYSTLQNKWAEIIKEESIEISGYKAEFNKAAKTVSFGCKKDITKKDLEAILTVMELNKKFDSIFEIGDNTLDSQDSEDFKGSILKETIEKLINKLEE